MEKLSLGQLDWLYIKFLVPVWLYCVIALTSTWFPPWSDQLVEFSFKV